MWSRITGMHLGRSAEFSTLRRSLAAVLGQVIGLDDPDDPRLSAWVDTHLRVNPVPIPDADALAGTEHAVLAALDPPLNLRDRPPTPIRTKLTWLRGHHGESPPADEPFS